VSSVFWDIMLYIIVRVVNSLLSNNLYDYRFISFLMALATVFTGLIFNSRVSSEKIAMQRLFPEKENE
jgi:hypothetical protein